VDTGPHSEKPGVVSSILTLGTSRCKGFPGRPVLVDGTLGLIRAREPRTVIYACHQVEGAPDSRIFYELYEDRAAFDEHEAGEHVKRFLAEREQYLGGPPRVEFLELPARFQPAVVGVAGILHG
jgi:hypothetical protein